MASYCECGHVLGEHFDHLPDEDSPVLGDFQQRGCFGDGGHCECDGFEELSKAEYAALDRGYV